MIDIPDFSKTLNDNRSVLLLDKDIRRHFTNTLDTMGLQHCKFSLSIDKASDSLAICGLIKYECMMLYGNKSSDECFVSFSIVNNRNQVHLKRAHRCTFKQQSCSAYDLKIADFVTKSALKEANSGLLFLPAGTLRLICEIQVCVESVVPVINPAREIAASDIPDDFGTLLQSRRFSDVTLISREGQEIPAHRAFLAARSPVFARMFEHDMREKNENTVEIKDIEYPVLKAVVQFVYTGTLMVDDDSASSLAGEIMTAADKYDIRSLKARSEVAVLRNLSVQNAVKNLIVADSCSSAALKKQVLDFAIANGREILKTPDFKELKASRPYLLEDFLSVMWSGDGANERQRKSSRKSEKTEEDMYSNDWLFD